VAPVIVESQETSVPMYAIVKTGGKQYKVAVGDVVQVEKIEGEPGTEVSFPALLVVDGAAVTADADALSKVSVTGKVVEQTSSSGNGHSATTP
jgi:large subunit ribosomal protein L21